MSPTFHRKIASKGKLNNALLAEVSPELVRVNETSVIAKAMSLWSAGYRSSGKGSVISKWRWASPSIETKKGFTSKVFDLIGAYNHMIRETAKKVKLEH